MLLVLNSQFVSPYHFRPNSGEGKPYLIVDQDQQYKITLKIEGKADLTAIGLVNYKFSICPVFRPTELLYSHLAFVAPDDD